MDILDLVDFRFAKLRFRIICFFMANQQWSKLLCRFLQPWCPVRVPGEGRTTDYRNNLLNQRSPQDIFKNIQPDTWKGAQPMNGDNNKLHIASIKVRFYVSGLEQMLQFDSTQQQGRQYKLVFFIISWNSSLFICKSPSVSASAIISCSSSSVISSLSSLAIALRLSIVIMPVLSRSRRSNTFEISLLGSLGAVFFGGAFFLGAILCKVIQVFNCYWTPILIEFINHGFHHESQLSPLDSENVCRSCNLQARWIQRGKQKSEACAARTRLQIFVHDFRWRNQAKLLTSFELDSRFLEQYWWIDKFNLQDIVGNFR